MPDNITVTWAGAKELAARVAGLSRVTQDHLAFMATSGAAHNVVTSAQANIQSYGLVKTGALIGNVARARKGVQGLTFSYDIGVRHGKRQAKIDDDPFYWFMLEFGKKGRPGTPFLSLALEQEKGKSLEIMQGVLTRGLARELAKAS